MTIFSKDEIETALAATRAVLENDRDRDQSKTLTMTRGSNFTILVIPSADEKYTDAVSQILCKE